MAPERCARRRAAAPEPTAAEAPARPPRPSRRRRRRPPRPAPTPPAGDLPADPGVRPPRGGRPDLDWPAADLQQVRPPRDK